MIPYLPKQGRLKDPYWRLSFDLPHVPTLTNKNLHVWTHTHTFWTSSMQTGKRNALKMKYFKKKIICHLGFLGGTFGREFLVCKAFSELEWWEQYSKVNWESIIQSISCYYKSRSECQFISAFNYLKIGQHSQDLNFILDSPSASSTYFFNYLFIPSLWEKVPAKVSVNSKKSHK